MTARETSQRPSGSKAYGNGHGEEEEGVRQLKSYIRLFPFVNLWVVFRIIPLLSFTPKFYNLNLFRLSENWCSIIYSEMDYKTYSDYLKIGNHDLDKHIRDRL